MRNVLSDSSSRLQNCRQPPQPWPVEPPDRSGADGVPLRTLLANSGPGGGQWCSGQPGVGADEVECGGGEHVLGAGLLQPAVAGSAQAAAAESSSDGGLDIPARFGPSPPPATATASGVCGLGVGSGSGGLGPGWCVGSVTSAGGTFVAGAVGCDDDVPDQPADLRNDERHNVVFPASTAPFRLLGHGRRSDRPGRHGEGECQCQASYSLTWWWSRPHSPVAIWKRSSTCHRAARS